MFSSKFFGRLFLILLVLALADDLLPTLIFGLLSNIVLNSKVVPKKKQKNAKGYTIKISL